MRITAAVTEAAGAAFAIGPVDLDASGPDDILVRMAATGICHTDLSIRDTTMIPWPGILGHEGAGIVEQVGAAVTGLAVGDHVVLTVASCGVCDNCRRDLPAWCAHFADLNLGGGCASDGRCSHSRDGRALFGRFFGQSAFATHAVVAASSVVPVQRDLPLERLAVLGCGVQTGAGAILNTLKPPLGSSIAIFGAGAVGLSAVMAARIAGCRRIVAIDPKPDRRELALEIGASEAVDPAAAGGADMIAAIGAVDFAVEASGVPVAMEQAIEVLGMNGVAALVGIAFGARVALDPSAMQARNLTVRTSVISGAGARPQSFIPQLIGYMHTGELPVERMIRYYPFEEIGQAMQDARSGVAIKPVLRFR